MGGRVGGFFQEIYPLRGSILQAETCKIPSLAENPRWSRVWQQGILAELGIYIKFCALEKSKDYKEKFRTLGNKKNK